MAKKGKMTYGSMAYLTGLLLTLILAVVGAGLGAMEVYASAMVIGMAVIVGVANIKAAEGQKFLLLAIAMSFVGFAFYSGAFAGLGLQVVEAALVKIGIYFMAVAGTGVVIAAHNMFKN